MWTDLIDLIDRSHVDLAWIHIELVSGKLLSFEFFDIMYIEKLIFKILFIFIFILIQRHFCSLDLVEGLTTAS